MITCVANDPINPDEIGPFDEFAHRWIEQA